MPRRLLKEYLILKEVIIVNEFNEFVREIFSAAGDIVIRSMMGGYLIYFNGKLIGDICDNELFLKRTPTSDKLLADSELRYPYEGSKTLMYAFDRFEDMDLITELLKGMYAELPEKKPKKAK
jgi:TfoX/Sxy family transcriptional regulator of competence genes